MSANEEMIRRLAKDRLAMLGLLIFVPEIIVAVFAPLIAPYDPFAMDFTSMLSAPSSAHLMGCDEMGRDIFSRIIYGTRYSLGLGISVVVVSTIAGTIIGAIVGYFGGVADTVIMRIKSTLGRTIIHLHESTGGTIQYNGKDITNPSAKEIRQLREKMQIIFQDPYSSLDPRMTVEAAISEPLLASHKISARKRREEVTRMMEMVGIDERLRYAYPHELDGGRRQRILRHIQLRSSARLAYTSPAGSLHPSLPAKLQPPCQPR